MARYFLAGNLWLVMAIVAFVGRTFERSDPVMYSFFGAGRAFYANEYSMLVGVLLSAALACFTLHWRSAGKSA